MQTKYHSELFQMLSYASCRSICANSPVVVVMVANMVCSAVCCSTKALKPLYGCAIPDERCLVVFKYYSPGHRVAPCSCYRGSVQAVQWEMLSAHLGITSMFQWPNKIAQVASGNSTPCLRCKKAHRTGRLGVLHQFIVVF
jgi:hypothetical protein